MVDWHELVGNRLSGLALDSAAREEVHEELAAHLEELYEAYCKQGLPEKEAERRTMEKVPDWQDLQRKVLIAKRGADFMRKRVQQLWIPGFLALVLSTTCLMTLQKFGFQPRVVGSGPSTILFYVPWLLSLPVFGAIAAYASSRAGGSRGIALLASIFPVPALGLAFLLMFPIGMIMGWITGNDRDFAFVATKVLSDGIGWLLIPAAALLVGGLLTHLLFRQRDSSQHHSAIG